MKNLKLIFAVLFLFIGMQAKAISFKENLLFTATLEGSQVVPAASTTAKGVGSFMLNKKRDSIAINISMIGLNPTSIGIYQGKIGTNGTLLLDLSSFLEGKRISTLLKGATVTGNFSKLIGEDLYILVGTATNPIGELRGQIRLEADWNFVADLKGTEAVPAITSTAYGLGSFDLSLDKSKLGFKIICQNLSGAITEAKLHFGALGTNGAESADLTTYVNGNVILGSISPSTDLLNGLFLGQIYLNISTLANPTGELRSQMRTFKGLAFDAFLTGDLMVPVVATNAKALGVFRLSPKLDSLYYDVVIDNISSNIDYSHLHVGFAGEAYDALQVDFTSSINGNRIKGFKKGIGAVSTTTINKLLLSNLTLVVHTANHPMGEIRGQAVRYAREGFTFQMDGAQLVPSVSTAANGVGYASINRDDDNLHYDWVANNLSGPVTGAHFHYNLAGQNGNVVYDLSDKISVNGSEVSASGFWKSTDTNPFLSANVTEFNNNTIYLNLHTVANPDGEIRGQVLKGMVLYAGTSPTIDLGLENTLQLDIAPNPVQSNIIVQFNQNQIEKTQIQLLDVVGKVMYSQISTPSQVLDKVLIDVSNLNSGVYFLIVSVGNKSITKKVVKG
jgi:hypothetical protein